MPNLDDTAKKIEDHLHREIRLNVEEFIHTSRIELIQRIRDLEVGLLDLLDDTQHSEHDCGDNDCPVLNARKLLQKTTNK